MSGKAEQIKLIKCECQYCGGRSFRRTELYSSETRVRIDADGTIEAITDEPEWYDHEDSWWCTSCHHRVTAEGLLARLEKVA